MRTPQPAFPVGPELIGEPTGKQNEDEADRDEVGEDEADDGDSRQGNVADEGLGQPNQCSGNESTDSRGEAIEETVQVPGQAGLDIEDREAEHQDEAGEHEAEAGEEAAQLAPSEAAEVDAELVGLGSRQHLIDGEELLEGVLGDPVLLVDALVLDHRDLRRRPAPGEQAELQEADEDGPQ